MFARAIILLSDGDDNLSHVYARRSHRNGAASRSHHLHHQHQRQRHQRRRRQSAGAHSRRHRRTCLLPFQIRDVVSAFAEIQEELRSQYAVSYKPADFKADGHYRTIEIVANDRKNFRVRARRGYYAPAQ